MRLLCAVGGIFVVEHEDIYFFDRQTDEEDDTPEDGGGDYSAADDPAERKMPVENAPVQEQPRRNTDAVNRALFALRTTHPESLLTSEGAKAFEKAIADASSIDPAEIRAREKQITDLLVAGPRKLESGVILPPWTEQNERELWQIKNRTSGAFNSMPELTQQRVQKILDQIKTLPASELTRKQALEMMLSKEAELDKSGKVGMYLLARATEIAFLKENHAGLLRRTMHQEEMAQLHSKAICQALYAIALDRAGRPENDAKISALLKDALGDNFAVNNIPELLELKKKYGVLETDPLDTVVPGRASLKKAVAINADPASGDTRSRLDKSAPYFEQAIGASDQIDLARVDAELKEIAKQAAELSKNPDRDKEQKLEDRAAELLALRQQPGASRFAYAMALHNASIDLGDEKLREKARNLLQSIAKIDPQSVEDPALQGALKLIALKPPRKFSEDDAVRDGKEEVEKLIAARKAAAGQKPDDGEPLWQKLLKDLGVTAASLLILGVLTKPVSRGISSLRRAWEFSGRQDRVHLEASPSLPPGEEPRLVLRQHETGRELIILGVRAEDGSLRVKNGEKVEFVRPSGKDEFTLKVAPDKVPADKDAVRKISAGILSPLADARAVEELQQKIDRLQRRLSGELDAIAGGTDIFDATTLPPELEGQPRFNEGELVKVSITGEPAMTLMFDEASKRRIVETGKAPLYRFVPAEELAGLRFNDVIRKGVPVVDMASDQHGNIYDVQRDDEGRVVGAAKREHQKLLPEECLDKPGASDLAAFAKANIANPYLSDKIAQPPSSDSGSMLVEPPAPWGDFRLELGGKALPLPSAADCLVIGRNPRLASIIVPGNNISRNHCQIESRPDGFYLKDNGSSHGTFIIRAGKAVQVKSDAPCKLLPGDIIRLGDKGAQELAWSRAGVPAPPVPLRYQPEGYKPGPGGADVIKDRAAIDASNHFLANHEFEGRLPNGFQMVSGQNRIDANGEHGDMSRPSFVVDLRPGKDPELEKFIEKCKRDFAHLKNDPEKLAEAIARQARSEMQPESGRLADRLYFKLRADNKGRKLLLGDYLTAARNGEGAGVCQHQSVLTKVAFDAMYDNDATRPKLKLVRGYAGESPAGLHPADALNHAWLVMEGKDGQQKVFDPRNKIYGAPVEAHPDLHPGKDVPQLKAVPPRAALHPALVGREVGWDRAAWRITEIVGDRAVISGGGKREASIDDIRRLNGNRLAVIGETYKIRNAEGVVEDGWVLTGRKADAAGNHVLILTKKQALTRYVPLAELAKANPDLYEHGVERPKPAPIVERPQKLVHGLEVRYRNRNFNISAIADDGITIVRPAQRTVSAEEFSELNGNREPKVGDEVLHRRSNGQIETWKVVGYEPLSGEVTVRSETAHVEKVPFESLKGENPALVLQKGSVEEVLRDPRSRIYEQVRFTAGEMGHEKYIGVVEGPDGQRVKVVIHHNANSSERARKDMAAQAVAKAMGAPELFPATAVRDGKMVQEFVGQDCQDLARYLHEMSREDPALRAQYRNLDQRIARMMEITDPALRLAVEKALVFTLLTGDLDGHGRNTLVERTGPKPTDIRVVRIDSDYAFQTFTEPSMARRYGYGDVVHGIYLHFSEKPLSPEVLQHVNRLSERLNDADAQKQKSAREQFALENRLTAEEVDAMAARAKALATRKAFPKSETHQPSEELAELPKAGSMQPLSGEPLEIVGPPPATTVADVARITAQLPENMRAVSADLLAHGVTEKSLKALADLKLSKAVLDGVALAVKNGSVSADSINAILGLKDTQKAATLLELSAAKGTNPELAFELQQMIGQSADEVRQTADLAKKYTTLEQRLASYPAADRLTVTSLKTALALQLAGNLSAEKLAELNRVVDKICSPDFFKHPEAKQRLSLIVRLVEVTNPELRIPFEKLLSETTSTKNLKFIVDRFVEAGKSFRRPADTHPRLGTTFEYNASRTAADSYHTDGKWVFIPAGNGSQADKQGIDGVLVDPETGEMKFIDWTRNFSGKVGEGKALWALEPAPAKVYDYANNAGRPTAAFLRNFKAEMESGLEGKACNRGLLPERARAVPSTNVEVFSGPLPMPAFNAVPESGAKFAKRFLDKHQANPQADEIVKHMDQRARNAYGNLLGVEELGRRLAGPVAQVAELDAAGRGGGLTFDVNNFRTSFDRRNPNEVTNRPMQYVELSVDMPTSPAILPGESFKRDGKIVSVRLYEDGTITGVRQYTDKNRRTVQQDLDLGHIKDLTPQMRAGLVGIKDPVAKAAAEQIVNRLNGVNANNPIQFGTEVRLLEAFGLACTAPQTVMAAHQRFRNVDEVRAKLGNIAISDSDAARIADRLKTPAAKSATEVKRAYDAYQLELKLNIDQAKAEQILRTQDGLLKSNPGLDAELARAAAILNQLHGVSESQAVTVAKHAEALKKIDPALSTEDCVKIIEQKAHLPALDQPLMDSLHKSLTESMTKGGLEAVWQALHTFSENEYFKAKRGHEAWLKLNGDLGKAYNESEFRKLLGLPEGGPVDAAAVSEAVMRRMAVDAGLPDAVAKGYASEGMEFLQTHRGGTVARGGASAGTPGAGAPGSEFAWRATDYSTADPESILRASLELSTRYQESSRRGLDQQHDLYFSRAQQLARQLSESNNAKLKQYDQLIRQLAEQTAELKNDPLLQRATLVADPGLASGGELRIVHNGNPIRPIGRDSKNVYYRNGEGVVVSAPLSQVEVQLRISQKTLSAAGRAAGAEQTRAAEVAASLFHHLVVLHKLGDRLERAKAEGVDLLGVKTTPEAAEFLEREREASELSADYMRYKLNGNSLDGKLQIDRRPVPYDLKMPFEKMTGQRMFTVLQPDGRVKMYIIDKNSSINEIDAQRAEELIKKTFVNMLENIDADLRELEKQPEKNREAIEKLKEKRSKVEHEQKRYAAEPAYRATFHGRLGRALRDGKVTSPAVTALFLISTAIDAGIFGKEDRTSRKPSFSGN